MGGVRFEDVVSKLYELPLEPSGWKSAIEHIGALVNASGGGQFHLWDAEQQRMLFSQTPDNWQTGDNERQYNEYFAADDPRRRLAERTPPGVWLYDEDLFDHRYVSRSELYDFFRRFGVRYCAAAKLHASAGRVAALGVIKTIEEGGFSSSERKTLDRLSQHLVRVAEIGIQLTELRERAVLGLSALDKLASPVIVTDKSGRILHNNTAAESMLASPPSPGGHPRLCVKTGYLAVTHTDSHARLKRVIASAVESNRGGVVQVGVARGGRQLICRVVPLSDSSALGCFTAKAALIAVSTQSPDSSLADVLGAAFTLTAAEARVAIALEEGLSLEEIAAQNRVAVSTVRSQLRGLFAKTGTRRQTELALLVRSIAAFRER